MKKSALIPLLLFAVITLVTGCTNKQDNAEELTYSDFESTELFKKNLTEFVRGAINPTFEDWVLFKNGTYIIFDNADTITDIEKKALELIKEFGPSSAGNPAGDLGISKLNKVPGWSVSGQYYGMYTYVHPREISNLDDEIQIGLRGRNKRDLDSKNPVIIHVNRKK